MKAQHSNPNFHPPVSLHIEKLVLDGFALGDRDRIGEAMQRELERLISMQGLAPLLERGGDIARLDGGTFQLSPSAKADAIGSQIAQSVYKSLIG